MRSPRPVCPGGRGPCQNTWNGTFREVRKTSFGPKTKERLASGEGGTPAVRSRPVLTYGFGMAV